MNPNTKPLIQSDADSAWQSASRPTEPVAEPTYISTPYTSPYITPNAPTPKQPKKRSGFMGLLLVGMLVLGMLLGGAGAGAVLLVAGKAPASTASLTPTVTTASANTGTALQTAQLTENTINNIYKTVSPSVVRITSSVQSGNGRFSSSGEAVGTGMILSTSGDILTNYHVINGSTSLSVELADGSTHPATVVGTAPQDDLAVIKVTGVSADKLTPVTLGDSSNLEVGDEVIAIGYPYGLDQSVTSGIISGLDREGSASSSNSTTSGRTLTGLIQVDAAINPGNSGGPLLNAAGQVIGINTMIESPVEGFTGVGLAIQINHAKDLLTQLEGGSTVSRPWLGISGTEIDSAIQQEYNLPVSSGVLVIDVTAGSPAEKAGLQGSTIPGSQSPFPGNGNGNQGNTNQTTTIGDIITAIDGHPVSSVPDLTSYLNSKQPGDVVSLTIIRNGNQQNVDLTLAAWAGGSTTNNK
jgi:S1-C subfamily serine protease